MVHSVVFEAPLSHTRVDVVFVGVDDCPDSNRGAHQWLDRYLLDVCQHLNNHFAGPLNHPKDGRLLFLQCATTSFAFQTPSTPLPSFFLTASGLPLCPATI